MQAPGIQGQRASWHWGYVIKGKVSFKSADGEETFETGDVYYVAPVEPPPRITALRPA
jgi:hypothetical protein